ncbi:hypothetical protein NC653_002862 [Populus alba x Populus x berolinensis]|uniref:Uncharacterized protein n=1 Tax=Populus alba x Populus x berolinensis TaxID=444605 RepID=A0AAD6RR32_9ROSI|nr:hypothetical protein NC653_002862 [Populus alba x Populus x berolinensis]
MHLRCEWFCTRNIDILVLGRIIALHNLILKDLMLLAFEIAIPVIRVPCTSSTPRAMGPEAFGQLY